LEHLVDTLGLTANVRFVGAAAYDGVLAALQRSDIFLLPSVRESFGTVLLEAQAVGLPIVATNVGGVHEAIVAGQSGFLVESCDPNALASRLTYLVEHQGTWAQMCQAGRKHVAEHFDIELLNDRLVKLYQVVASAESADLAQAP
jgi:colanic acid/amylovoran biosynthesis glycosyltransferase